MTTWECWTVILKGTDDTDEASQKEQAAIKAVSDGIRELAKKIEADHGFKIEVK